MQSVKNKAYPAPSSGKDYEVFSQFNVQQKAPNNQASDGNACEHRAEPRCGICDGAISSGYLNQHPVHSQERSKI